jgi:hypothetical protein
VLPIGERDRPAEKEEDPATGGEADWGRALVSINAPEPAREPPISPPVPRLAIVRDDLVRRHNRRRSGYWGDRTGRAIPATVRSSARQTS